MWEVDWGISGDEQWVSGRYNSLSLWDCSRHGSVQVCPCLVHVQENKMQYVCVQVRSSVDKNYASIPIKQEAVEYTTQQNKT